MMETSDAHIQRETPSTDESLFSPELLKKAANLIPPTIQDALTVYFDSSKEQTSEEFTVDRAEGMIKIHHAHMGSLYFPPDAPGFTRAQLTQEQRSILVSNLMSAYLSRWNDSMIIPQLPHEHYVFFGFGARDDIIQGLGNFLKTDASWIITQTLTSMGKSEIPFHVSDFIWTAVGGNTDDPCTYDLLKQDDGTISMAQRPTVKDQNISGAVAPKAWEQLPKCTETELPLLVTGGIHGRTIESLELPKKNYTLLVSRVQMSDIQEPKERIQQPPSEVLLKHIQHLEPSTFFPLGKLISLMTPEQREQFGRTRIEVDLGEVAEVPIRLDMGSSLGVQVDLSGLSKINQLLTKLELDGDFHLRDAFAELMAKWQLDYTKMLEELHFYFNELAGDGARGLVHTTLENMSDRQMVEIMSGLLEISSSFDVRIKHALNSKNKTMKELAQYITAEFQSSPPVVKVACKWSDAKIEIIPASKGGAMMATLLTQHDSESSTHNMMEDAKKFLRLAGNRERYESLICVDNDVYTKLSQIEPSEHDFTLLQEGGKFFVAQERSRIHG